MKSKPPTAAEIDAAYARATWTLWGHGAFVFLSCLALGAVRRVFGLPPQTIGVVLLVAVLVFSRDIYRWLRLRSTIRARLSALRS